MVTRGSRLYGRFRGTGPQVVEAATGMLRVRSSLVRRAALALAALAVAALALAARADAFVYWTNLNTSPNTIGRANTDGSGVTQSFITVDGSGTTGVAVDDAHIYWAYQPGFTGAIGRANLDGTSIEQTFIDLGPNDPAGVAVDGAHVYWTSVNIFNQVNTIGRANLDGSGVDQSFITGASFPFGVAVSRVASR
jgi:DNA-binding beta-propeller fold protein YncE